MDETVLISKLESSDFNGVRCQFSDYLDPFSDLTNPKKTKRTAKQRDDHKSLTRSLAKKFLPFLNRALSALPKRLADPSGLGGGGERSAMELFQIYRLCLGCLESVSSELSGKPHSVHFQRLRMVRCLETWRRWRDAEAECFGVLEKLKEATSSGKSGNCLLPDTEKCGGDSEFASLVLEIVVSLVKCVSLSQSKDIDDYRRVLRLVEESQGWLRVLDANTYEKLHRILVAYVGRCTVFFLREVSFVDVELACELCKVTMAEYAKSSISDQIYEVARSMCSTQFSRQDSGSTFSIKTLTCILDSIAAEGKIDLEKTGTDFFELIAYCAYKCQSSPDFCSMIGAHLNKIAKTQVKTPCTLILRLYATGLLVVNHKLMSKGNDTSSSGGVVRTLCSEDLLLELAALLCSLKSYVHKGSEKSCVSSYTLVYLNALKFICLPLSQLVNSEKKQIISESDAAVSAAKLCHVQEAFFQFYDAFFLLKRIKYASVTEKDGFDETKIVGIAVALFIISIGTKLNMQKSVHLLKDIISSEWIQPNGLKHLFTSVYNVSITLYRDGRPEEALKALKLSCSASWTYVLHLCGMLSHKADMSSGDLSENAVLDFVQETCNRTAFLLNALHECNVDKVKRIIVKSLENWVVAADMFCKLQGPMSLVKQWVKIECKTNQNADAQDTASSLYSFMSSFGKVSKRTIGIILEQELHAYKELNVLHPDLCQKMQMKIIGYQLNDVYTTPESWLQRSKILVQKGRLLRFYGHCFKDCIQCLSDAISSIQAICGETCNDVQPCHQLAVAYCLRAFCTQEAEPNSKQVFLDIRMALKLWLSTTIPNMEPDNTMILLFGIIDLLSLKGCMDYHYDVYKLMYRLFQLKNVPFENSLAVLWECRRVSHALCVSSVNGAFLRSLADHYDGLGNSVDIWKRSLKGSIALQVGFAHSFSYLFSNSQQGPLNHESSFQSRITLDEVKNSAFQLISSDPTSRSVFVAGYLFFDLSERLISEGQTTEGLVYAKEAHRLRTKLFKEKFKFSVDQLSEKSQIITNVSQKGTSSLQDLQMHRSVADELWSRDSISWDMENCYISPWAVLECYLESTLQVGVACEIIGDGAEAEGLFVWGRSISCSQNLPLFVAAFSSVLGKLYCKKQLWDLAEKELYSAKQYLEANDKVISCLKCKLMLNATVDQHLGDLSQSVIENSSKRVSSEGLSCAESLYKSALDKLSCLAWKISTSIPEVACSGRSVIERVLGKEVEFDARNNIVADIVETQQDRKKPSRRKPKENQEVNKSRKTRSSAKTVSSNEDVMLANNVRTTRSRNQSSKSKCITSEVQVANQKNLLRDGENICSSTCDQVEVNSSEIGCGFKGKNKMRCWQCLQMEVAKNGLLTNFVDLKWEYFRRRLSLRLLTGLASCLETNGQIHEAHGVLLQTISILANLDLFHLPTLYVPDAHLLDIIGDEVPEDMLSIERAEILYTIGRFSLRSNPCESTGVSFCHISNIQLPKLVDGLMHAYILCSEVPMLFQKVCRLLALVFLLACCGELCSLPSYCKALSESQWASFFHQASVGTHLNYHFFTSHQRAYRLKHSVDADGSDVTGSICLGMEMQNLPRLAPKSVQDLEEFVINFFVDFGCTTAICFSLLDGSCSNLLQEILKYNSRTGAWMLVSRLDFQSQPVVLLLPINTILEEASEDAAKSVALQCSENVDTDKRWKCPWGSTMVDNVAPELRLILNENYISSSVFTKDDTPESRKLWWTWRKKLDYRLGRFLGNIEDSWLGPWKYIILGRRSDHKRLESIRKKLARSLKTKCKMDVNESLLSIILGAPKDVVEEEEFILHVCLKKGCYIGTTKSQDVDMPGPSSKDAGSLDKSSKLALEIIHEALNAFKDEICIDREPIILVVDSDVQMVPWENIPLLRNQEVYRMPSVWSISKTLHRNSSNEDQSTTFPCIDPLDAFYLLNPGGDLGSTQMTFEKWFRDQNFEGKSGNVPTAEELAAALKSHDLFLYFGHGSGTQYIPGRNIQKLENCAATLLMGCSSGSLTLNGCYAPHGTPLCYLIAGSPAIVANLWDVTDKDIDRFGKAVLEAWFNERLTDPAFLAQELEALSLKKKVLKKLESHPSICDHRPGIGSFIGRAREACTLPYLIGAAPVCYGVPTVIRNKKDSC